MRIVTPVSVFDQARAGKWCEVIKHLDCGRNHELHIVTPRSAELAAAAMQEELRDYFESVKVHVMEGEPIGGWPYGPNTQFHACATFMARDNGRLPWFLCELDCYPLRSNSFDVLSSRYTSAGVPFFGKIGHTFWRDDNGKISSSLFGKDDTTMSGCAVYPGDLPIRRFTAPLMSDLMKGFDETSGAPNSGWDVHLRFAIKREGVSDAGNLIADNWNTINYRVENGRLACDNNPNHELYRQHPNFELRKTNATVGADALFIHGCKDDSLPDLILADKLPQEVIAPKQPASTKVIAETNDQSKLQDELTEMRKMMLEQQKLITSLLQQKTAEPVKIIVAETPIDLGCENGNVMPVSTPGLIGPSGCSVGLDEVISPPNKADIGPSGLTQELLLNYMKGIGKALSCKTVAAHFGIPNEEMALFVAKTPGLKLSGPPVNWITLAD